MMSTDNGFKMISGRTFLRAEDGEIIELANVADVQFHEIAPPSTIEPYEPQFWTGTQEIKLKVSASATAMNKAVYSLIFDLFFNGRKDCRRIYHIFMHTKKRRIRKKALKRLRNMLWEGEA